MHGKIARHIAQNNYNVNDNDEINAIEFHTTGRKNERAWKLIYYRLYRKIESILV